MATVQTAIKKRQSRGNETPGLPFAKSFCYGDGCANVTVIF